MRPRRPVSLSAMAAAIVSVLMTLVGAAFAQSGPSPEEALAQMKVQIGQLLVEVGTLESRLISMTKENAELKSKAAAPAPDPTPAPKP